MNEKPANDPNIRRQNWLIMTKAPKEEVEKCDVLWEAWKTTVTKPMWPEQK